MGEYATYQGQVIKIGTCEEMYYLRADQRHLVADYTFDAADRFRFPFPDEDHIEPGRFVDYDRGLRIPRWRLPTDFEGHGMVQLCSRTGYVLCIPCPEQYGQPETSIELPDGLRIGRHGFIGHPKVVQQKVVDEMLVTVISCGACGSKWRLSLAEAAVVAQAFIDDAQRRLTQVAHERVDAGTDPEFQVAVARRIMEGYATRDE